MEMGITTDVRDNMYNYLISYTFDGNEQKKYIVAPDWGEAQNQMYSFMERKNVDGDIIDLDTRQLRDKTYMDTETGELLTERNVFDTYVINYPNREITFMEYIRNCIDKNGFLEEVDI